MAARSTIKLDENQTLNLRKLSYVGGLTSKGQVGVLLMEHRGVDVAHGIFIYSKILCTTACFPISPQRGINYPPTCVGPPFSPERETFCVLSFRTTFGFLLFIGKLSFCRCAKQICLPRTSNLSFQSDCLQTDTADCLFVVCQDIIIFES